MMRDFQKQPHHCQPEARDQLVEQRREDHHHGNFNPVQTPSSVHEEICHQPNPSQGG
jgi:hypothetical protein